MFPIFRRQLALLNDLCMQLLFVVKKMNLRVNISGCASYGAFSRKMNVRTLFMNGPIVQLFYKKYKPDTPALPGGQGSLVGDVCKGNSWNSEGFQSGGSNASFSKRYKVFPKGEKRRGPSSILYC